MDMNSNLTVVNLNIIQWNCQSINRKAITFESFLSQEKVHIAVLSETWLKCGSRFNITGYNIYRFDRTEANGGVAIVIHRSIKSFLCTTQILNSNIEFLHVRIDNCRHIENIIAIYCTSPVQTTQSDWDSIFSLCCRKTLILGDFNAHHTDWSYKTNRRGRLLHESMLDHSFISLNNGAPTRIRLVNGVLQESSPDISFVSSDLATSLSWKVTNESLGSDHLIIKISSTINIPLEFIKKRNFKKSDWLAYRNNLDKIFQNFSIPENVQIFYNLFEQGLQSAAELCIPYVKIPQHINNRFCPKPYWDAELSKTVAERRLALAKFRRCPSAENLEHLQDKIRNAQKVIRSARCKAFQKFCSSIDETTSSTVMWSKMRWLKGHNSHPLNRNIDRQKIEQMLIDLTPDYVNPQQPQFYSHNVQLEGEITLQEIKNSIKKNDTAPGSDEISFSMIKNLPPSGYSLLLCLYNRIFSSGYVPSQWQEIKVVPIPKPSRDLNSPASLRPISLISCLCKIFHSIMNKRMEWFFEKQSLFSDNMIGFRKGRSCFDNLTRLVAHIQIGFSKNLTTVACFIDIDSAYNNVDVTGLTNILDGLGIGSRICLYLWSFLSERRLKVNIDGNYLVRTTGRGLAQGDPWSSLLFNVATLNVCDFIQNVEISQYADDFVLYVSNEKLESAIADLQSACDELDSWLNCLGLVISLSKSKFCIFKKGGCRKSVDFRINNTSLPKVDTFKYLGLWLDSRLRWRKHIEETAQKTSKLINILKILAGSGWGLHQKHLRRLYISLVRSRIDYASFFYDNSCKTHLSKLDKIQNQALRVIGGYIRSTPIHVMESDLYLPPLQYRRKFLAAKFWLKAKSFSNNKTISILKELSDSTRSSYWRNKNTLYLFLSTQS